MPGATSATTRQLAPKQANVSTRRARGGRPSNPPVAQPARLISLSAPSTAKADTALCPSFLTALVGWGRGRQRVRTRDNISGGEEPMASSPSPLTFSLFRDAPPPQITGSPGPAPPCPSNVRAMPEQCLSNVRAMPEQCLSPEPSSAPVVVGALSAVSVSSKGAEDTTSAAAASASDQLAASI